MTETIVRPIESVETERKIETSNNKPECAHIVLKPEGESDETVHAYVMRARIEGFPIVALCGYTWVPNKKAEGLPVCEECKAIYDYNPNGMDRDGLPDE